MPAVVDQGEKEWETDRRTDRGLPILIWSSTWSSCH